MLKVHILDRCPHCDGKAYLPAGETFDSKGEPYNRYISCPMCEGTGERGKWVRLPDFLEMLQERKSRLEEILTNLPREQADISSHLQTIILSDEQVADIEAFCS